MKTLKKRKVVVVAAVAVAGDGALFVSDDGGNVVWRVSYAGR